MSLYVNCFLPLNFCGYQKRFSTQQALISLLGKWRIVLDSKGYACAILIDLSKVFDTFNRDLLISMLHAYDFFRRQIFVGKKLK